MTSCEKKLISGRQGQGYKFETTRQKFQINRSHYFRFVSEIWIPTFLKKKILITTLTPTVSAWMASASVPVTPWNCVPSVPRTTEGLTICKLRTTSTSSALRPSSKPSGRVMIDHLSMFLTNGPSSLMVSLLAQNISKSVARNASTGAKVNRVSFSFDHFRTMYAHNDNIKRSTSWN